MDVCLSVCTYIMCAIPLDPEEGGKYLEMALWLAGCLTWVLETELLTSESCVLNCLAISLLLGHFLKSYFT